MRKDSGNGTAARVAVIVLVLGASVLAPAARAQSVQKCIAGDGRISFTSHACGDGERLAATYSAVPETEPERSAAETARPVRPESRQRQHRTRARAGAVRGRKASGPCEKARERRERTLQRVGLKRTFDLLRKLDEEVWDACR